MDKPLIKHREELIEIVCDSIGNNGHFFMSQKLLKFNSNEIYNNTENVERNESPWIGRKIMIETDSNGFRFSHAIDDSLTYAAADSVKLFQWKVLPDAACPSCRWAPIDEKKVLLYAEPEEPSYIIADEKL